MTNPKKKTATIDDFRRAARRRVESYYVEGFGNVRVQSLNEKERAEYEVAMLDDSGKFNRRAAQDARLKLILATVVNDDGKKIFTPGDLQWLRELDSVVVERLTDAINRHLGWDADLGKKLDGSTGIEEEGLQSS